MTEWLSVVSQPTMATEVGLEAVPTVHNEHWS